MLLLLSISCLLGGFITVPRVIELGSEENTLNIYKVIHFKNGSILQNGEFVNKSFYSVNGKLSFKKLHKIDSVVDLTGLYVIPPFAEGHNHSLESSWQLEERINSFLSKGVFYAKIMSSMKPRLDPLLHRFNKPDGIDIVYTYAPITANGGHPIQIREDAFKRGDYSGLFTDKKEIENNGYYIINNEDDLNKKLPGIISENNSFVKIMILFSEEYEKRKGDSTYFGRKGLNPQLIESIVTKVHKAGLKVAAHIESAADFHVAVDAGVDEIAHLPCLYKKEPIDRADALLAAQKKIVVTTTLSLLNRISNAETKAVLLKNAVANLTILKEANVELQIGSDDWADNSVGEAMMVQSTGVFSNAALINMWTKTPVTMFPNRKIGIIKDGYEASFIALKRNPLVDFSAVKEILLKVKNGKLLK